MKHFLRLFFRRRLGLTVLLALSVAIAPQGAKAQSRGLAAFVRIPNPLLMHASSRGYLGVDLSDVDQEKAQALKLKEVRGALITLIDHDAPAGKCGLKVNDVVLQLNGQNVEGAEQLRRILREGPAGRKISMEISRVMEHEVWTRISADGDLFSQQPGMAILAEGADAPLPGGFHMPFFGGSLKVGALVEPLTSQMAEYLGVPNGLMVKQVVRRSEASAAGIKAFDVILKVGPEPIHTVTDWERLLRTNQGKSVQITISRAKKTQVLTLMVDSKHHSQLLIEDLFPADDQTPPSRS
jgi:C-terminal processing protease CtpA/Prc